MAFKIQDAFQYRGVVGLNDKFVSGKREAYYISKIGLVGTEFTDTHNFTTGSVPTGWDHNTSSHTTTSQFTDSTAGNYFLIKGNATGNSYPLRWPFAFQGDYLFQLSFYASNTPSGSDWGMCVSDDSYTSRSATTEWTWAWSASGARVAVQNNVQNPYIYGTSSTANTGGDVEATAGFKTMHFQHRPSTGYSKLKVTTGSQDWNILGTQLGSTVSINETIVSDTSTNYWLGIGADNDTTTFAYANACRFTSNSSEFF